MSKYKPEMYGWSMVFLSTVFVLRNTNLNQTHAHSAIFIHENELK